MKSNHLYQSFFTPVAIDKSLPRFDHSAQWMLMGSCFSTEMGERLKAAKFDVVLNPYGVLYNPISINTALERIVSKEFFTADKLVFHRGLWHSLMHHSTFSNAEREPALEHINQSLSEASEALPRTDVLLLTWGSAYVYTDTSTGAVVGNCHQLPERLFERRRLSVDEIVTNQIRLIDTLLLQQSRLQIIITVSPIRHLRDGLHADRVSKSTLLLAADALCERYPDHVHYFPSYELLIDELRDYRFYADDLVHPSPTAINYIWDAFTNACLTPDAIKLGNECKAINKALAHRPFHPESEEYMRFLEQIVLKINQLSEKYPYLDFENERKICHTLLMK